MVAYGIYTQRKQRALKLASEGGWCAQENSKPAQDTCVEKLTDSNDEAAGGKVISGIRIVYATETGNSERIAEQLAFEIKDWPCHTTVIAIEDFDEIADVEVDSTLTIFVVSTAGQGVAPTAAQSFMRSLKAKKYRIGKFVVVGLGHTSYKTYNEFAKNLFNDLQRQASGETLLQAPILIDCAEPDFEPNALQNVLKHEQLFTNMINVFQGLKRQAASFLEIVDLVVEPNVPKKQIQLARDPGRASKTLDKPLFEAKIGAVKKIISADADGRLFHVVNVTRLGIPDITVGNAVKIWTPAPEDYVDLAFKTFGEHLRHSGIAGQTTGGSSKSRFVFPKGISFDCIFRYVIDWTSTPSTALMTMIHNCWLAERPSCQDIIDEVRTRRTTLFEYLSYIQEKRSTELDLPLILLPKFPRVSPRVYTVASAVKRFGVQSFDFDLCITENATVRAPAPPNAMIPMADIHYGRVSGFLRSLTDRTDILITRATSVCSLSHAQKGGIWVGAGSGVSMLRAFVDERRQMFKRIQRTPASAPKTSVYMSFRALSEYSAANADDLFEFAVVNNLVAEIYVSITRPPDVGVFRVTAFGLEPLLSKSSKAKMYLGDVIKSWRPSCYEWFVHGSDGNLIVCGSVGLKENLIQSMPPADFEKLLNTSRFIAEVW